MSVRPKAVTIISWLSIIMGALMLAASVFSSNNPVIKDAMSQSPVPLSLQYFLSYVGAAVSIVTGIMMLQGKNWARLLFVIWYIFSIVMSLATVPNKVSEIPAMVLAAVFFFFLFRPKVNEYFKGSV